MREREKSGVEGKRYFIRITGGTSDDPQIRIRPRHSTYTRSMTMSCELHVEQ